MDKAVSATDANRNLSQLLRGVRQGRSYVVTSHDKPVARLVPATGRNSIAAGTRAALFHALAFSARAGHRSLEPGRTLQRCRMRVALDTNILSWRSTLRQVLDF